MEYFTKKMSALEMLPVDCFAISNKENYILYIPLKGLIYHLNSRALKEICYILKMEDDGKFFSKEIKSIVEEIKSTSDIQASETTCLCKASKSLILDLSNKCTLACKYCYGGFHDGAAIYMNYDCAKEAIRLCLDEIDEFKSQEKIFVLIFHGGSEPTTNWNLFCTVIEHAKKECLKRNIKLILSMSTNGYYSEEKAHWIASNFSSISLSLDGYEKIQNTQRPTVSGLDSFDTAFRSGKIFYESMSKNFSFALRPTVTNLFVNEMPEVAAFFSKEFPKIEIQFEPAKDCGRCRDSNLRPMDPYFFWVVLKA